MRVVGDHTTVWVVTDEVPVRFVCLIPLNWGHDTFVPNYPQRIAGYRGVPREVRRVTLREKTAWLRLGTGGGTLLFRMRQPPCRINIREETRRP